MYICMLYEYRCVYMYIQINYPSVTLTRIFLQNEKMQRERERGCRRDNMLKQTKQTNKQSNKKDRQTKQTIETNKCNHRFKSSSVLPTG